MRENPDYTEQFDKDPLSDASVNARRWFREVFWPLGEARRQVIGPKGKQFKVIAIFLCSRCDGSIGVQGRVHPRT